MPTDQDWMQHAIRLAQRAEAQGEVPVGALIVKDDVCIAEGWNQPITKHDPTAHAEIDAIRKAGQVLQNYRLLDTCLYVTLEPCIMCIGAIVHARISKLVIGADDPKRGAVYSVQNLSEAAFLNHRVDWCSGVMARECGQLLIDFFKSRRR
jgi:tRNA(adenine34) deaminase